MEFVNLKYLSFWSSWHDRTKSRSKLSSAAYPTHLKHAPQKHLYWIKTKSDKKYIPQP